MTSATSSRRFSIDELSTLAGVTPRTVRYYIGEGLLERPEGEKRGAYYRERHLRHLRQLLQIRRWANAGLSLERIRELIAGTSDDLPPRTVRPGTVEVWSRITLDDGHARIDGILFSSTLRQTWRHTGEQPLEVIYSFPLPPKAPLLSFAAVRGDERLEGSIAPRKAAEGGRRQGAGDTCEGRVSI